MTPQQKKDIVKFVVAGLAAILIGRAEKLVNKKADAYFGPDEEQN